MDETSNARKITNLSTTKVRNWWSQALDVLRWWPSDKRDRASAITAPQSTLASRGK
jgi:hypothetical protein